MAETAQEDLMEKLCEQNPRFRQLYEEHHILEKELASYEKKGRLTAAEETQRKKVQKLKLAGRDEMERIMRQYQQAPG